MGRKTENKLTKTLLDVAIDGKLASSKSTNHEQTSRKTSKGAAETKLASDLYQTGHCALTREALRLVYLGQHGISRLRNNGGSKTCKETGSQVHSGLGTTGQLRLIKLSKEGLRNFLKSDKFGDCVWNPGDMRQLLVHVDMRR